jgi:hypothetical protein
VYWLFGSRRASVLVALQLASYLGFAAWVSERSQALRFGGGDAFERSLAADLPSLLLLPLLGLLGLALSRRGEALSRLVRALEAAPWRVAGATTLLCALLSLVAFGARPLVMDEIAPLYQARVLAQGSLYGEVSPDAIEWLFFPRFTSGFFTIDPYLGRVLSYYWPGFALALAPLEAFGAGFLLNPLLAGGSVLLVRRVALDLSGHDRAVAGTAMLLLLAAPAFAINAATYYSMNAHAFANLAFVALLLKPSSGRLIAAGAVCAWGLSLHNPFPHAVFALPWLIAQLKPADRWRRIACLALGYLPLVLLLVVGYHFYRNGFLPPKLGVPAVSAQRMLAFGFELPALATLEYRLLGLGKLMAWSSFGLVPLAVLGAFDQRRNGPVWLLAASALATLLAYLVTPYSQGHGWGYRYFHGALATLPLLAAFALSPAAGATSPESGAPTRQLRTANSWWALGALAICLPLRAHEVSTYIGAHYRQRNAVSDARSECVHFMKVGRGDSYVQDLIWNEPRLEGRDIYLMSHGERNEPFVRASVPEAQRRATSATDDSYCAPSLAPLRARLLGAHD